MVVQTKIQAEIPNLSHPLFSYFQSPKETIYNTLVREIMRKSAILAGLTVLIMGPIITAWIYGYFEAWRLQSIPIIMPSTGNVWQDLSQSLGQRFYYTYTVFLTYHWQLNLWILPAAHALFYVSLKQNKQKVVT